MKRMMMGFLMMMGLQLAAQNSQGTVDIEVTTLPNGETFSPKHVLAIWIEDSSGEFVQTLKLRAEKRKQYLYTWNSASSGNTTDAITGATLQSHETHSLSWDCTDVSGAVVADGDYAVMVEYTSAHKQGPLTQIDFTKSGNEFSISPPNETYYIDMNLVYTPPSSTAVSLQETGPEINIYPVPVKENLYVEMNLPMENDITISLYSTDMKLVDNLFHGNVVAGRSKIAAEMNRKDLHPGTYILVIRGVNLLSAKQISLE